MRVGVATGCAGLGDVGSHGQFPGDLFPLADEQGQLGLRAVGVETSWQGDEAGGCGSGWRDMEFSDGVGDVGGGRSVFVGESLVLVN